MYYWIIFPIKAIDSDSSVNPKKKNEKTTLISQHDQLDDDEKDTEQLEAEETKAELNKKLISQIKKNRKYSALIAHKSPSQPHAHDSTVIDNRKHAAKKYVTPPFYQKVFLVWSSPYTKFWMRFLMYICYLVLFSFSTLWPGCGNLILDSILWLWTATETIENTRIAYKNYLNGSQLPVRFPIFEIFVMISFLVLFFWVRIYSTWNCTGDIFGLDRVFASKTVLCFYLIYFFYRTVFIFLPISQSLGPMLVMIKHMVKRDFMIYLRLFLIFMTAGI